MEKRILNVLSDKISKEASVKRNWIKELRCLLSIDKNEKHPKDRNSAIWEGNCE